MGAISNFPTGFSYGVNIREIPVQIAHPGKVFWVNNSSVLAPNGIAGTDSDGSNKGTYLKPFASINYAISQCLANRGDIIMVMPGHIEAITASSLALNKAGIGIYGLGEGDLRPQLQFGATTSNIAISAADCSISNIVCAATVDQVVSAITVSAEGCTLNIESKDGAANKEFINFLATTASASNLVVKLKHRGFSTGTHMTRYLDIVGTVDARIEVDFYGTASTAVVSMRTTASKNVKVIGKFYNASATLTKNVTDTASSTWSVRGMEDSAAREFAGSDSVAVAYITPVGTSAQVNAGASVAVSAIKVIPQSTSTTVFTVTGGPILLEYLAYEVTTVVQTQACNFKFTSTDTASSTSTDLCANLNITGQAVGTFAYVKMDALATALTATAGGTGLGPTITNGIVIPVGSVVATTSASNTGNIKYHLRYKPLDPNAVVTVS